MADAIGSGCSGGAYDALGGEIERAAAEGAGSGDYVGDSDGCGRWAQGDTRLPPERIDWAGALFPPGPADRDAWSAIIRERPDLAPAISTPPVGIKPLRRELAKSRATYQGRSGRRERKEIGRLLTLLRVGGELYKEASQCCFRELADGSPGGIRFSRQDQLRSLGNMVVPMQGACALLVLIERATEG